MRRAAAAIAIAVSVAGCSLGRPAAQASGSEIYAQLCANCHGSDLSGGVGPPVGPGSNSVSESDEFLVFTIVNGRGRMPSFSSSLDDAQVERLVAFIREEQGE